MLKNLKSLRLSDNRKTRFFKEHKNTFGIRAGRPVDGGTCPGSTVGEGGCMYRQKADGSPTCYAAKLRKIYPGYGKTEDHNTDLLMGADFDTKVEVIRNTLMKFLLNGGHQKQYFRLHMGGDFFNEEYTHAWAKVIAEWPLVRFWTYTRSMFAVEHLAHLDNLSLYLSCDPDNEEEVRRTWEAWKHRPNVAIAWMGNEIPAFLEDRPVLPCPEVKKQLKTKDGVGACSRCRACVDRKLKDGNMRHIQFPIHR